jgi:hypothetical protein
MKHMNPAALCMLSALIPLAAFPLAGCPPPSPVPPGPDSSDAAPAPSPSPTPNPTPTPPAPPGPTTPCQSGCDALATLGCPEGSAANCVRVMADHDKNKDLRTPSGKPLSCADLAGVKTVTGARALGITCGSGH